MSAVGKSLLDPQVSSCSEQQAHQTTEAGNASQTCIGSKSQHSADNAKLQQLWEDAQAAMQESQSAECWSCQGGNVQQPTEASAAERTPDLEPLSSCVHGPTSVFDQVLA